MAGKADWTPEQEDEMLEEILPCNEQAHMDRAFVHIRKKYGLDAKLGPEEGEKWIRRRANRRSDYTGPANENSRRRRDGLPFTWMENKILNWAFAKEYSESNQKPTVEYIANLLQRTVEEVEKAEKRRTSTRFGIKGFFE